jgi:hypothetical protein
MPRKRRPAHQLTDKELAKRVFPAGVHKQLKRLALELEKKPRRPRKPQP